jgi:hypothetical protein
MGNSGGENTKINEEKNINEKSPTRKSVFPAFFFVFL